MAAAGQRWRPVLGGRLKARCGEGRGQVAHGHGWRIVAKKVTPDHVHPLVRVGPTNAPASVARTFKGRTARVLRDELPHMRQGVVIASYFAASVGYVWESMVGRYIEHQWDAMAP